jgi:hypothetical protein
VISASNDAVGEAKVAGESVCDGAADAGTALGILGGGFVLTYIDVEPQLDYALNPNNPDAVKAYNDWATENPEAFNAVQSVQSPQKVM